ncbi:pentapeptide repeat-containing protein [Isoptericola sp. b515]|uniref:pentapeptide repeat-containing protein n=1 Tax=Isoptericola sp. b515 TaxID=3064652 RepID=UPI00271418AA|nr:pentapeptide repeat-containing protein [Isoptericola sp. b515]MDO8149162.1 pentapeptide repeat-containing protein [Isoptericola sp. b515]
MNDLRGGRPNDTPTGRRSHAPFRIGLAWSVVLVVVAAALGAAAVLWVVWRAAGEPRIEQIDILSIATTFDALKFAGGLVIGVGGSVALVVAYRKQHLGEAEHRRQEQSAARDQTRLFNERFARASDQIGSDRPAIRLAGVYSMAGLADDWSKGRQSCIDVLCAYLRMPYRPNGQIPSLKGKYRGRPRPWEVLNWGDQSERDTMGSASEAQVRSSVVQILRERLWEGAHVSWNGAFLDFTGAVFEDESFDGADFTDCNVRFDDCLFLGECGFSETTWRRSVGSFLGAVYAGRLGFEYSIIDESEITLYGDFVDGTDINFQGVVLKSGSLRTLGPRGSGGSISFVESDLSGGTLQISGPKMTKDSSIAFSRSILSGTEVVLEGGEYLAGHIWCNGMSIAGGSFAISAIPWSREPVKLAGTELAVDDARVTGGEFALRGVEISGSDVHLDQLEMTGGRLDLSSCTLSSGNLSFSKPVISDGELVVPAGAAPGPMTDAVLVLRDSGIRTTRTPPDGGFTDSG